MKTRYILLMIIVVLLVAGCAAGSDRFVEEKPAGFWAGLWHGLICIPAFIVRLFNRNVHIYEAVNSGIMYDFGFVIGLAIALGGSHGSGRNRKKCRCDDGAGCC